ncbi:hypothetical protein EV368DRAFT_65171 [Lentinula lateritia]|uniref:Uncharacterized protein n=1 Tax=Lentinula aff. lateritia TaxID=2804960 RepID=A0ACC1TYX1_9AGAR|nr:hypothetical protein F5876DRAFT_66002 [Lentinula aff. lateritia]KAJ3852134.1 hypothetical protein EV368DRAFT_65171 [Lentinula lateritia]
MVALLPYELYELIIDELRYSFPDLKACPRRVHGIEKERMAFFLKKFTASFTHTFNLPEITSCVQGLSLESHIRDVMYSPPGLLPPPTLHSLPKGKAVIQPSIFSVDLPFQSPLRFLRTHWRLIDMLDKKQNSMNDIQMFELILDRSHSLEHLVIENYWQFHARRDILCSIAVHAPNLKTLCLSEFRWFPSFNHLILEDIFDEWLDKFVSTGVAPLQLDPMSAKDLCAALGGQFPELGKELVHLTVLNLNTSSFRLLPKTFPKLSELQLFDLTLHWSHVSTSLDLHINFEIERDSEPNLAELSEAFRISTVDSALDTFIKNRMNHASEIWVGDAAEVYKAGVPTEFRDRMPSLEGEEIPRMVVRVNGYKDVCLFCIQVIVRSTEETNGMLNNESEFNLYTTTNQRCIYLGSGFGPTITDARVRTGHVLRDFIIPFPIKKVQPWLNLNILGIRPSATAEEVRRAYKQRALETHPDKLEPGASSREKERAERSFREVHEAFVVLGDVEKRKAYDIRTHIPTSLSYQKASDEAKRRMEDRAEWQRQQQERRKASMAEIREKNRIATQNARERRFKAAEQATLVKNMVDELLQLTPEWEQRRLHVQQAS